MMCTSLPSFSGATLWMLSGDTTSERPSAREVAVFSARPCEQKGVGFQFRCGSTRLCSQHCIMAGWGLGKHGASSPHFTAGKQPKTPAFPGSRLPAAYPTPLILSTPYAGNSWCCCLLCGSSPIFLSLLLPHPQPRVLIVYMGPFMLLPKTCDPGLANQDMGPLSTGTLRHL